ncbi:MAG: Quinoprotein glucose dehydrogenase B [Verrucomicrobia subdivision 3 bacterium]|nr:Quinoprotein glucose dehydrogenase B [Limisphaerales bacterium]MCS1415480.1 Quinoprotein glucose dehydrogenase B [Limisphaerales bacterium]
MLSPQGCGSIGRRGFSDESELEAELRLKCLRYFAWALLVCAGVCGQAQPIERVANTTLSFPLSLPTSGFRLELAFEGIRSFSQPVAIVSAPGETYRLFVVERAGRIRVIPDLENPTRQTFLSLTDRVESRSGEQGLLGLAFHPDYQRNGTFFVFYTARGSGSPNRLSRFQVDPTNPDAGLPDSEVILFSQRDDAGNHNGGDLHFGPDGYLYVALGDEGNANDSLRNSQLLDKDFFAGILRLDVDKRNGNLEPNPHPAVVFNEDGRANYSVPADNPFVGITEFNGEAVDPNAVHAEFWAVGLRNPWRMAFDPATGELYAGDVGQNQREEINLIVKGGNYGWNYREGKINGPNRAPVPAGVVLEDPLLDYSHGSGSNQGRSVTGGVVYRGSRLAQLFGAYIFADYVSANVWWLRHDGPEVTEWENILRETAISAFGTDPRNGDVLLADFNSNRVWRLVKDEVVEGDPLPKSLAATGAFADLRILSPNPGVVPYSINAPFWSDGAIKSRWFSVPNADDRIGFSPEGNWAFPSGMVWIKHFDLEIRKGDPTSRRRLETRFIVQQESGVYGMTYRWDDDQQNAFLVPEEGMDESFMVEDNGILKEQVWRYPSRSECLACHTKAGGGALGFSTSQLNRPYQYGNGQANQIQALSQAGYLLESPSDVSILSQAASVNDKSQSLSHRVRSYLAANCSQCHQPGGTAIGLWDGRFNALFGQSGIINGALANPSIHQGRRVVVPGDPGASDILRRISSLGSGRMPPVASNVLDQDAIDLLNEWITEALPPESFDDWVARYFGPSQGPETLVDGDFDQDRLLNRLEFRLGTNPRDAKDVWRISVQQSGENLLIGFPRVSDETLRIELQQASTLSAIPDWQVVDLDEPSPFFGRRGTRGVIERLIAKDSASFFRVVIHEE